MLYCRWRSCTVREREISVLEGEVRDLGEKG